MTIHTNIMIADTVFAQEVDNEMVILDTASEEYFGLDAMGAVIWQYLSMSGSLQEVYDTMREEYEVDDEQLEADICRFVQELVDANLVQKKL